MWGDGMLVSASRLVPPRADVQDVAHSVVSWLEGAVKAPTTLDYVLLGLAGVIVYWLRRYLSVVTAAVTVEVEPFDDDDSKLPVHAVTAALRECLDNGGLCAPIVPSGTPRAGLIDAVAAAPLPQGAFIAKLMQTLPLPEPLQYKLSGSVGQPGGSPQVCLWLRPDGSGRSLMRTLPPKAGPPAAHYEEVVESAAFEIHTFISTQAVRAVPRWARWHSTNALNNYRSALDAVAEGRFEQARHRLASVVQQEPDNALVWLQHANVSERIAYPAARLSGSLDAERQAETLRRYLWIADQWPWLVQARYRASVVAGALAAACGDRQVAEGAKAALGLVEIDEVEPVLNSIATAESDFALQLLKPWYMLVRWHRTRSQFEPGTVERRELKRAVGISRHALHLRRISRAESAGGRAENALRIAFSEVAVRCWHLSCGLIAVDWQTQYVAACFDALLLGREDSQRLLGGLEDLPESIRWLVAKRRHWWRGHLRRRALQRLDLAVADAGALLPPAWVLDEDPDLAALRENHDEWLVEMAALQARANAAAAAAAAAATGGTTPASSARVPVPALCSPSRPWPKPSLRGGAYVALGLVLAALAIVLLGHVSVWSAAIHATLAGLLWCVWRAALTAREGARRRRVRAAIARAPGRAVPNRSSRRP